VLGAGVSGGGVSIAVGSRRVHVDDPEKMSAVRMRSLRWHYPDQVLGSTALSRPLSPLV